MIEMFRKSDTLGVCFGIVYLDYFFQDLEDIVLENGKNIKFRKYRKEM